jgi:hypothetical protein
MKALDQGCGLILEREEKIKQCIISNLAISLDCQISSIQRSTTVFDPPTITQLQLWSLGDRINHTQVTILQSTPIVNGHPPGLKPMAMRKRHPIFLNIYMRRRIVRKSSYDKGCHGQTDYCYRLALLVRKSHTH